MSGARVEDFAKATVISRRDIADDVVELTLSGGRAGWSPGAHLEVTAGDFVRQYSLCGDTAADSYTIAVRCEVVGRGGSRLIHETVHEGSVLIVRGPYNHFELVDAPQYLFVAGGIGITPLIPMIVSVEAAGKPWRLEYGGRSLTSMAYQDTLVDAYGDRVRPHPADTEGLLDLEAVLGPGEPGRAVYACGPEPLLLALEEAMSSRPEESLHLERFVPKDLSPSVSGAFEVEIASTGALVKVGAEESIIDALHDAGFDVDFSCREGTCGTCELAVLDGVADHRDSALSDEEKAANDCLMICVSRSKTPVLKLDL